MQGLVQRLLRGLVLTAVILGVLAVTGKTSVLAQNSAGGKGGSEPFYLGVEKRRLDGVEDENNSSRLSRKKLIEEPPLAPPLTPRLAQPVFQSGVQQNGRLPFPLKVEDWGAPGSAKFGSLNGQTPLNGSLPASNPLKGAVSVKTLANYDVELIVDESLSMRKRDCPGGVSRWDWCGMQLGDLSRQLAPLVPHGFTLTTFAGFYQVYENATPQEVNSLFENPEFNRGTRLSQPLNDRLGSYFRNRRPDSKPVLIVVITDGVPVPRREPDMVAQTLIAATKQMRDPREVTVVFFQIGGTDEFGRAFLSDMDHGLVNYGAKFDIVKTVPFEQLQSEGLTRSLVMTIKDAARRTMR